MSELSQDVTRDLNAIENEGVVNYRTVENILNYVEFTDQRLVILHVNIRSMK